MERRQPLQPDPVCGVKVYNYLCLQGVTIRPDRLPEMENNYLLLVSDTYAFPILRPLQKAIREKGGTAAWFVDNPACRKFLAADELELRTVKEVKKYAPKAVFIPGNHSYHFFPGVHVQVFHGFAINKRNDPDDDFRHVIRGWFDLYAVNEVIALDRFQRLSEEYGSFKAVPTGWSKLDSFNTDPRNTAISEGRRPVILYSSTFSRGITSTPYLYDEIERLVQTRDWDWIITFHPLMAQETMERYKALATRYDNVTFYDGDDNVSVLEAADVMLCDSSSIIMEFQYLDKPVVTFRNTQPDDSLMDISDVDLLESSIEAALSRPADLMERIRARMDSLHPWRDGESSVRVLEAVDAFVEGKLGPNRPKKISLVRKIKARKKLGYWGGLNRI